MTELVDLYKKELEIFLSTLSIYKGDGIINTDETLNEENRRFIKEKFIRLKSGNVDESVLDKALDALIPYLYVKN